MPDVNHYVNAKPYLGKAEDWIPDEFDRLRVGSYSLYENIYWTVEGTLKVRARGEEDKPIYIPSGRVMVNTINRYVANGLSIGVDPAFGTSTDQALALQVWDDFRKRERFYSKFNANKKYGIMKGDWVWHLYANPNRAPGSKVSIFAVDPSKCFPIYMMENEEVIVGWDIAEQIVVDDKPFIRRLRYIKQTMVEGPSPIIMSDGVYEVEGWHDIDLATGTDLAVLMTGGNFPEAIPPTTLPQPIDHLPLYLIPNSETPGIVFGNSEMRGVESLIAAITMGVSDEDLSLAMDALGVYATDAGRPVDDDNNPTGWNLGPGRVVELPTGKKMERITGTSTVKPYQDHFAYLHDQVDQVTGAGPAAKGRPTSVSATSGIALQLEMAPLLAHAIEKDQIILDQMAQLMYDLGKWFSAYEGSVFNVLWTPETGIKWVISFGPKLPTDPSTEIKSLAELAGSTPPIVSAAYVRRRMVALGYTDIDETAMAQEIAAEQQAASDIEGVRLQTEVDQALADTGTQDEGDQ